MKEPDSDRPFPRSALIAAAALVVISIVGAATARLSGFGAMERPRAEAIASRDLRFEDRSDGAVVVTDATMQVVEVLAPGSNGFVRGVLRGLARERKRLNVDTLPPFRLTRWSDGRLSLDDPATRQHIELESFGQTNIAAFSRFLHDRSASR